MFGELKHDMTNMKNEIRQEWKQDLRQEMSTIRQDVSSLRQEHHTSLRNLEVQVAQNSKALTERPQGSLPSTTVNNPRERAQAVTLRSGKELPEPILKKSTSPKSPIEEEIVEETLEEDKGQEKEEPSPPLSFKATQAQDKGKEKVDLPMYQPPLPFPGRHVESVYPTLMRKTGNDTYLKLLCDDNDNDLESFAFDENVLSSENDNDVHDALHDVLDDDDVNDNDGLCDLNDVEFMPTNTRSKERAKKTRHDREASSSRAPQGVSDLIAPGGRGLPHLTEKQRERVEELQQKGVSGGFYFDYTMLDAYGCREEVEQMMRRPYWERLFNWREDTYEPVVHEFVATFEPVPSSHDCTPCMKFNLFGRGYQLSLIQLGERLGLYTHEETMSEEWINLPRDFESDAAVEAYWSRITNGRGGRESWHRGNSRELQPFNDAHLGRSYVQRIEDMPRPPREEKSLSRASGRGGAGGVPPEYADYHQMHDWASMRASDPAIMKAIRGHSGGQNEAIAEQRERQYARQEERPSSNRSTQLSSCAYGWSHRLPSQAEVGRVLGRLQSGRIVVGDAVLLNDSSANSSL
nr:uncharacterized protein LOC109154451 [Ipomoea batatas]